VNGSVQMKLGRQMPNHVEKQQILLLKNLAVYSAFKDDIRQLADLKQQISQKMIITLQHSDILAITLVYVTVTTTARSRDI